MDLTFMSKEGLRKAMGDLKSYEILDSLPLPESYEVLDMDRLEAVAKADKEESK